VASPLITFFLISSNFILLSLICSFNLSFISFSFHNPSDHLSHLSDWLPPPKEAQYFLKSVISSLGKMEYSFKPIPITPTAAADAKPGNHHFLNLIRESS